MRFTQIPNQHTPLGGKVVYAFATDAPTTGSQARAQPSITELRIASLPDEEQLGTKRYVGVTAASFDAAPYLRRAVRFVPTSGGTGFYPAAEHGRTVAARIEATHDAAYAETPERTFLPCIEAVQGPTFLTSMPLTRLIAPGECDELTLLTDAACSVTVTAEGLEGLSAQYYQTATGGLQLFRLDTSEFPDVHTITVDAGAVGQVVYSVIAAPAGARRLAWRSSAGSIEHYTFPIERSATVEATKSRGEGAEGGFQQITQHRRRALLASAYEHRATAEGLAGIIETGDVWEISQGEYLRVEVTTNKLDVHRQSGLSLLEIELMSTQKSGL